MANIDKNGAHIGYQFAWSVLDLELEQLHVYCVTETGPKAGQRTKGRAQRKKTAPVPPGVEVGFTHCRGQHFNMRTMKSTARVQGPYDSRANGHGEAHPMVTPLSFSSIAIGAFERIMGLT